MGGGGDDLHIGHGRGVKERGGHLAHAAAGLLVAAALSDGGGHQIALIHGAAARDLVEGQGLAALQHGAVEGRAGDLDVLVAVEAGQGVGGIAGDQAEILLQLRLGHRGLLGMGA